MSTLTRGRIIARLKEERLERRLTITPLLTEKQIGDASIDVRLGNQFILFRTHMLGAFKPYRSGSVNIRKVQERQVVKFGGRFVLHPGMLTLGATFEYMCIPHDIECQVEGRSSWSRVGLQIATANSVEPGFKGVLTLELSNVGTVPIELYPGVRIAQLIFHDAKPETKNAYGTDRKYICPVGPEFSRISDDIDGAVFVSSDEE